MQRGLDELISVAKKITNTEFLLQLRNLDMPDRKVMRNLLEFMTEQINFDVSHFKTCKFDSENQTFENVLFFLEISENWRRN